LKYWLKQIENEENKNKTKRREINQTEEQLKGRPASLERNPLGFSLKGEEPGGEEGSSTD